jgi:SAM-dependent methyltransferase
MVGACRYVDEVIPDAPLVTSAEYMDEHKLDKVAHGDDYSEEQKQKYYKAACDRGAYFTVGYTGGISTTEIIRRAADRYTAANVQTPVSVPSSPKSGPVGAGVEKERNERWNKIWQKKGSNSHQAPHVTAGFDGLSEEQYTDMITRVLSAPPMTTPIGSGSALLDAGCGPGGFLRVVTNMAPGCKFSGFDPSERLVEMAKYAIDGDFAVGTLPDACLMYGDASFTHTVCFSVFLYLNGLEMAKEAVQELLRVTQPGGHVLIGDVNDASKYERALELRDETHRDAKHVSDDNPDHLYIPKSIFEEAAAVGGHTCTIIDDTDLGLDFYPNAEYRYMVYLTKAL